MNEKTAINILIFLCFSVIILSYDPITKSSTQAEARQYEPWINFWNQFSYLRSTMNKIDLTENECPDFIERVAELQTTQSNLNPRRFDQSEILLEKVFNSKSAELCLDSPPIATRVTRVPLASDTDYKELLNSIVSPDIFAKIDRVGWFTNQGSNLVQHNPAISGVHGILDKPLGIQIKVDGQTISDLSHLVLDVGQKVEVLLLPSEDIDETQYNFSYSISDIHGTREEPRPGYYSSDLPEFDKSYQSFDFVVNEAQSESGFIFLRTFMNPVLSPVEYKFQAEVGRYYNLKVNRPTVSPVRIKDLGIYRNGIEVLENIEHYDYPKFKRGERIKIVADLESDSDVIFEFSSQHLSDLNTNLTPDGKAPNNKLVFDFTIDERFRFAWKSFLSIGAKNTDGASQSNSLFGDDLRFSIELPIDYN